MGIVNHSDIDGNEFMENLATGSIIIDMGNEVSQDFLEILYRFAFPVNQ